MERCHPYITRRGLHRSRYGIVFGVCKGVADYFGFRVFWLRIIVLVAMLITGFWPVLAAYLLAALIMKKEPRWGFWRDY
ncbi:MAG: PspC domain-containing protein [Candidatus Hydrogenedentes bacterium]|nr:PspC domain-containing protein [Candidatus Hydrogenedentota bacterium]